MRFRLIFLIFLFKVLHISAQTSLLSSGEWVKIGVVESGIYKIDKKFLQEYKILTNNFDPNKIQVYGSGYNGVLPQLNSLEIQTMSLIMMSLYIFIYNLLTKFILITHQINLRLKRIYILIRLIIL